MAVISVIMGVYNPKDSLRFENAVKSILNQSFKDLELIIYDDGSSKPARDLIKRIAALDRRITLISGKTNRGLAYALNECLKVSSGEYIARMDDDDVSLCNRFEKQLDFLKQNPDCSWVGSSALLADSGGVWGVREVKAMPIKKDYLFNSPYIHPSVVFKKSALESLGGYSVSARHSGAEDYELFMRMQSKGYKGLNITSPLIIYFEDASSYKKRTFKRRLSELVVRYEGFKRLGLLKLRYLLYLIKPLAMALLPGRVVHYFRKKRGLMVFGN